jgi:lipopolysaccharide transport system ATP-binding protein
MCSDAVVVRATQLGKRYDIYERPYHRFVELFGGRSRSRAFWAVRNVNLEVMRGETVGIVGRNGSGKSTLLQMVCGTLTPDEGTVTVDGRVAALLELGAGFNPEFTGLENIQLNAALMGLSRTELSEHLDGILGFADIGDFVRQPVRTYSSGMYVRLAFAIAIAVDPDVLVVDEALAVGDEAFQRKCFARIEAMKERGAAILFVSHSAGAVLQLCDRAVLMEHGTGLAQGSPKRIVGNYHRLLYAPEERRDEIIRAIASGDDLSERASSNADANGGGGAMSAIVEDGAVEERYDASMQPESTIEYTPRGARISNPKILTGGGRHVNVLAAGREYLYRYLVDFQEDAYQVRFGMMIRSVSGVELAGLASHAEGESIAMVPAGARASVTFRFRTNFLPGVFFMNCGCEGATVGGGAEGLFLHRILDAVMFRIERPRSNRRTAGFFDIAEEPACAVEFGG